MRAFIFFVLCVAFVLQLYFFSEHYLSTRQEPQQSAESGSTTTANTAPGDEPHANPVTGIEVLRGTVVDDAGKPVPAAPITVIETDLDTFDAFRVPRKRLVWQTESDATGQFHLDTLAPGGYVAQTITAIGGGAAMATLSARGGAAEITLRIAPGRKVLGSVHDWQENPIEDAHVFIVAGESASPSLAPYRYLPVKTGSKGEFRFEDVPNSPAAFLAVAKGFAPVLIREQQQVSGELAPLKFRLTPGIRFAGYLVEADSGRQADKATLYLVEREFGLERYRASTSASSSFLFQDIRSGSYEIRLDSSKYALESSPLIVDVRDGLGNVDVRVIRAGRIKGRVLRDEGRAGVEGISVLARAANGEISDPALTNAAGHYTIDGIAPGTYSIEIDDPFGEFQAEGGTQVVVEATRVAAGPVFHITPGAAITGRVLDASGRPAPGANVYVSFKLNTTPDRSTRAGADGRFIQGGIPVGAKVRVWASRMDRVSVALGPEVVNAEGLHDLTFTLSLNGNGAIEGTVVDRNDAPVPYGVVSCYPPDLSLANPIVVKADASGVFRIAQLIEGAYHLKAAAPGATVPTESRIDLRLEPGQRLNGLRIPTE